MNNKLPQIHLIYNRYKKASTYRKAVVEVRISYNYKQKYISTGIMLYPHQWKNGIITNVPDAIQLSKILDKMLTDIKKVIYDMIERGSINIYAIPDELRKLNKTTTTFIEFCNQRATIRKYGKRKDTQERYDRFIRLFTEWGKIKTFDDINDNTIIGYDRYLTSKGMKNYSKWQNYHRFLNSFIIDAINEGLLQRNPYKWVNIYKDKESKGIEKCLTPNEFRQLERASMPTECLSRVRDLFVFQTYTCMSYTDLSNFNYTHISKINDTMVYTGKREKTLKPFTIPLLSQAIAILEKYKGKLPIISNVKYNAYLKVVAQSAGIDKKISSHWARHTGATLLLNEGIPMQIVSKICGHSSIRITEQIYAKLLDETVVQAVAALER